VSVCGRDCAKSKSRRPPSGITAERLAEIRQAGAACAAAVMSGRVTGDDMVEPRGAGLRVAEAAPFALPAI
jgi:hypothetical protein